MHPCHPVVSSTACQYLLACHRFMCDYRLPKLECPISCNYNILVYNGLDDLALPYLKLIRALEYHFTMRSSLTILLALCLSTLSLALQWKTFDISSMLLEEEKNKIQYLDTNGNAQRLEHILRNGGANSLKMRIWVNPSDGIYNLDYAVRIGRRAKDAGLPVVINLHYSDTWADPAHQSKPSAWNGMSDDAVYRTPPFMLYSTNLSISSSTKFVPTPPRFSMPSTTPA